MLDNIDNYTIAMHFFCFDSFDRFSVKHQQQHQRKQQQQQPGRSTSQQLCFVRE